MQWVPYTGPPQSFVLGNLTRDGDWTMAANKATSARPAPQQSGNEEDLLPAWSPVLQNARATYSYYNEWTINTAGWIDQYGVDILTQNLGATHVITLTVGGTVRDTFTYTPSAAGVYWHDITPIVVTSGAVLRVTLQVTQVSNNQMYWLQQAALFATAPTYCSLAVGSKDGAAAGTTAYGSHLRFIPGAVSPDWDIVAFSGSPAGGGGGGGANITYQGAYSATQTYNDGDIVVGADGITYQCVIAGTTGVTPAPWAPAPTIPYGTSLPASPVDGMEAVLVDSTTNPSYQWRFRYNAGSTSAYKWECVGSTPQHLEVAGGAVVNTGVWSAFTGLTLTFARAGQYMIQGGWRGTTPASGTGDYHVGYAPNGVIDQSVADWQVAASTSFALVGPERLLTVGAAGNTIGLWYWATYAATDGTPVWISARPVRVS
jgi:hypothetical protein